MTSHVGHDPSSIWSSRDGRPSWGGTFSVQWTLICNLPFNETLHLHNRWNEDKPVKISRDGQELPPDVGEDLLKLFQDYIASGKKSTPRKVSSSRPHHEAVEVDVILQRVPQVVVLPDINQGLDDLVHHHLHSHQEVEEGPTDIFTHGVVVGVEGTCIRDRDREVREDQDRRFCQGVDITTINISIINTSIINTSSIINTIKFLQLVREDTTIQGVILNE
eukprot:TRINITY_DN1885_c0_g1_i1.p1 TRINITY_DN1885_c0_g1~~TRINITY_DN1885_c0_g1_i1.p1  ORF type:complete len:220 (-),score=15.54 TRINITY_DN1885_c0_g1_i1:344-1003(-)